MAFHHPAFIAGAFEHPMRHAPDKSVAQLHAEVAKGALEDAGLVRSEYGGINVLDVEGLSRFGE